MGTTQQKRYVLVIPELRGGPDDAMRQVEVSGQVGLETLRERLGCDTVDVVDVSTEELPGLDLWIDDEGLMKPSPQYNVRAMALVLHAHGVLHQFYVGRGVVALHDGKGDLVGLTTEQLAVVRKQIRRVSTQVEVWAARQSILRSRR